MCLVRVHLICLCVERHNTTILLTPWKISRNACEYPIDRYLYVSPELYFATGEQLIPTSVHGPFNLVTCPITHVPICPLAVAAPVVDVSVRRLRASARRGAMQIRGQAATLSELSEHCFLSPPVSCEVRAHNRQSFRDPAIISI